MRYVLSTWTKVIIHVQQGLNLCFQVLLRQHDTCSARILQPSFYMVVGNWAINIIENLEQNSGPQWHLSRSWRSVSESERGCIVWAKVKKDQTDYGGVFFDDGGRVDVILTGSSSTVKYFQSFIIFLPPQDVVWRHCRQRGGHTRGLVDSSPLGRPGPSWRGHSSRRVRGKAL